MDATFLQFYSEAIIFTQICGIIAKNSQKMLADLAEYMSQEWHE